MSTMVERAEIPEHIWDAARSLRGAVLWESNSSVEHIARSLLAAVKRGKEEAAKIAEEAFTEATVRKNAKGAPYSSGNVAIYAATRIAAAIRGS